MRARKPKETEAEKLRRESGEDARATIRAHLTGDAVAVDAHLKAERAKIARLREIAPETDLRRPKK